MAVTNGDIVMPNAAATCTFTNTIKTSTVGGSVTDLGGSVTLQLQVKDGNGNITTTESKTLSANGVFTFTNEVNYGGGYVVTVTSQPTGQTCTVAGGSSNNVTGDVSGAVSVSCTINTYKIKATAERRHHQPGGHHVGHLSQQRDLHDRARVG